jgi:hypothetical protein
MCDARKVTDPGDHGYREGEAAVGQHPRRVTPTSDLALAQGGLVMTNGCVSARDVGFAAHDGQLADSAAAQQIACDRPRSTRRTKLFSSVVLRPALHAIAGIVAACVACMTLSAQDVSSSRPTEWGVMIGGVGVTGAFRGHISTGVGGGLEVQIPFPPPRVALRADVMYHTIADYRDTRGCTYVDPCADAAVGTEVLSGSVSVVARLNSPTTRWSPYIFGGVAIYHVGTANSPIEINSRPNPLGFQGGVGFEVRSGKHTYFAEMRYMGMSPGGLTPLTIGMRF